MKKVLTIVTVSLLAINASALMWYGNTSEDWFNGNNWTDDSYSGSAAGVPTSSDNLTFLNAQTYKPKVSSAGAACNIMYFGKWGWDASLKIDQNGTLDSADIVLGNENVNTEIINDGVLSAQAGGGVIYMNLGSTLLVNNGTVTNKGLILGNDANSVSSIVTNNGDMTVNGWLYLSLSASNNPTLFYMQSGTVNVSGKLEMSATGRNHLELEGGTINTVDLGLNGYGGYTINVNNGRLIANGDQTAGLDFMIGADLITATSPKTPVSSYDSGTDKTTLMAIPEPATIGLISILGLALLRRK